MNTAAILEDPDPLGVTLIAAWRCMRDVNELNFYYSYLLNYSLFKMMLYKQAFRVTSQYKINKKC